MLPELMAPELMAPELMAPELLVSGGRRQRMLSWPALVAQGIEHRPPEPGAQVRILPGAPTNQPSIHLPRSRVGLSRSEGARTALPAGVDTHILASSGSVRSGASSSILSRPAHLSNRARPAQADLASFSPDLVAKGPPFCHKTWGELVAKRHSRSQKCGQTTPLATSFPFCYELTATPVTCGGFGQFEDDGWSFPPHWRGSPRFYTPYSGTSHRTNNCCRAR